MAFKARNAELKLFTGAQTPGARALRELLALQSSDWAFLAYRQSAGEYPRARFGGHLVALERASELEPTLRGLAPYL
jgi:1,4-alpha-glucan branching enzyme